MLFFLLFYFGFKVYYFLRADLPVGSECMKVYESNLILLGLMESPCGLYRREGVV